jgi:DNA-binding response OmpR family regulator
MDWTVVLLSDQASDVRDVLPSFPHAPYKVVTTPLKTTEIEDLISLQPNMVIIDATSDIDVAEAAAKRLSLAWQIGLPPIIAVVDKDTVARFRLEAGADDFLMSDASTGEISARLALVARKTGHGDDDTSLKVGDLTVNPDNYQVYVHGRRLDLTYKEFELLKFLAQRPGRVCDRDLLLREVWGYDYFGGTRTVDVHIRRLRAKLGAEHETLIETIRNVGYRLVPRPRER